MWTSREISPNRLRWSKVAKGNRGLPQRGWTVKLIFSISLLCLTLTGCKALELQVEGLEQGIRAQATKVSDKVGVVPDYSHLQDPKCHTVKLYDKIPVKRPGKKVPPEFSQFLGVWERGAWDGTWCHDLHVLDVSADGTVDLLDMHAPNTEWKLAPSVFRRTARIHEDGSLRFRYGTESRRYELKHGKLIGVRTGGYGQMKVALSNKNFAPLPIPRPVRAAKK